MSTYQPPGGTPSEPTPYAQPQDPWANAHETGVAAAPTDPIPQQPYGQFTPGVAAPSVWTQETMSQGGYAYAPPRGGSRVGLYVLVFLAVVVLGGGGGYGAYWLITQRGDGTTPTTTSSDPPTSSTGQSASPTGEPTFVASAVKVGDCLLNTGTGNSPAMKVVDCSTAKSYEVLKITAGESIPEGPNGKFDADHTGATVCAGTGYTAWYAWDSTEDKNDYFFCLSANP
jgi:hypothetical protein